MALNTGTPTNGETLTGVREYAHYTINDVAQVLTVEPDMIVSWENNIEHPTFEQLQQLATIYDVNTAVLLADNPTIINYLPAIPVFNDNPIISKELHQVIRAAVRRRETFLELHIPQRSEELFIDNKNIITSEQLLYAWVNMIECNENILVTQTEIMTLEEFHGLSIYHPKAPIIILNAKNSFTERTHALLHQVGHIKHKHNTICSTNTNSEEGEEQWCDTFADITIALYEPSSLNPLNINEHASEPVIGSPIINNLGIKYVTTILHALNEQKISELDASYYLGVKISDINMINKKIVAYYTMLQ